MNRGLLMSDAEKAERHRKLYKVVSTHTSHHWASVLVKMLLGQMGGEGMARQTPYIPRDVLNSRYKAAKKRLFLFDYDVSSFRGFEIRILCVEFQLILLSFRALLPR